MKREMSDRIQTHQSLASFFEELLREAMAVERIELEAESFAYVTNLFTDFATHRGLHGRQRPGERGTPALVWLYQEAQEARDRGGRFDAYRHLGDVSLIVSGFFTPHLERERSLVGVDYYVQMGTAAYDAASSLAHRTAFSRLLAELAAKFEPLVEVLTRMAERTTLPIARDLRALYERMMRNPGSLDLRDRMLEHGVAPVFALSGVKN
jgi:hypothetical protein